VGVDDNVSSEKRVRECWRQRLVNSPTLPAKNRIWGMLPDTKHDSENPELAPYTNDKQGSHEDIVTSITQVYTSNSKTLGSSNTEGTAILLARGTLWVYFCIFMSFY